MSRPKLVRCMVELTHKARDPFWNRTRFAPSKGEHHAEPMFRAVQELARVLTIYGYGDEAMARFAAGLDVGRKQGEEMGNE